MKYLCNSDLINIAQYHWNHSTRDKEKYVTTFVWQSENIHSLLCKDTFLLQY